MKIIAVLIILSFATLAYGHFSHKPMNYLDAANYCRSLPGSLPEIDSQVLNEAIFKGMVKQGVTRVWIGITRRHIESDDQPWDWVYESNHSDSTDPTRRYWGPDEPNNFRNHSERCVEMRNLPKNGENMNWNDRPCDSLNQFFCDLHSIDFD